QVPGPHFGDSSGYDPLFPFGAGLSYTKFGYTKLRLREASLAAPAPIEVSVEVQNRGRVAGREVVQVLAETPPVPVLVPARRLIGFGRVALAPGETRTITLAIPSQRLAVVRGDVGGDGEEAVEPGLYKLVVGDQTTTL